MTGPARPGLPADFAAAVTGVGSAMLATLQAFEWVQRRLHPPALPGLRAAMGPLRDRLDAALEVARAASPPDGLAPFHAQLVLAAQHAARASDLFLTPAPPAEAVSRLLESFSASCRAQEALYPLRTALPPVARFFLEPTLHGVEVDLDPDPPEGIPTGILVARAGESERSGFHLYVPERYRPERAWPLVVALHGAAGRGGDFLYTWLREARSRGFLLLAPTSRESTWSMHGSDHDGPALAAMVETVRGRWSVDPARTLLVGLSDGGTYALLSGLGEASPFRTLACVSGVLHPSNLSNGNLGRARGRRIYVAHGALDWLFPPALARLSAETLRDAGADVTHHEIADLSHTWPREENDAILRWLDPALVPAA